MTRRRRQCPFTISVAPLPTISGVAPAEGPPSGGTAVTITGTGFLTATSVTFAGVDADAFTVVSDTQIDATTPANDAGTVDVVVTSSGGAATASNGYTYLSNDAQLTALAVSDGTLSPAFDPTETNYTVPVGKDVDAIALTPTVSDAGATVTVAGNATTSGSASAPVVLSVGTTPIAVVVTAADGTTRSYTVAVTRAASSDAQLSALAVSAGALSPSFDPAQTVYTVSVGNDVDAIALTPTVSDFGARVTVDRCRRHHPELHGRSNASRLERCGPLGAVGERGDAKPRVRPDAAELYGGGRQRCRGDFADPERLRCRSDGDGRGHCGRLGQRKRSCSAVGGHHVDCGRRDRCRRHHADLHGLGNPRGLE